MKYLILVIAGLLTIHTAAGQSALTADKTTRILTPANASLSLSISSSGQYSVSYQNQMTSKKDIRSIIFKNKKDAKSFVSRVSKALKSPDGYADFISYSDYTIRLLSGIGGVFMIVNESGHTQSTFRISSQNCSQLGVL